MEESVLRRSVTAIESFKNTLLLLDWVVNWGECSQTVCRDVVIKSLEECLLHEVCSSFRSAYKNCVLLSTPPLASLLSYSYSLGIQWYSLKRIELLVAVATTLHVNNSLQYEHVINNVCFLYKGRRILEETDCNQKILLRHEYVMNFLLRREKIFFVIYDSKKSNAWNTMTDCSRHDYVMDFLPWERQNER